MKFFLLTTKKIAVRSPRSLAVNLSVSIPLEIKCGMKIRSPFRLFVQLRNFLIWLLNKERARDVKSRARVYTNAGITYPALARSDHYLRTRVPRETCPWACHRS